MPISLQESANRLRVKLDGTPSRREYERTFSDLEEAIEERGHDRILVNLEDFSGWDLGSRWDREEFRVKTFDEVAKVAFVGETQWSKWMEGFRRPFAEAEVRFFDERRQGEAEDWLTRSV